MVQQSDHEYHTVWAGVPWIDCPVCGTENEEEDRNLPESSVRHCNLCGSKLQLVDRDIDNWGGPKWAWKVID